jgi:DNA-3-methyladenine glycosylase I
MVTKTTPKSAGAKEVVRCPWAGSDPLYLRYHDEEWGVPLHDDRRLFEMIVLEGAQAGLSWITVLRKREAYRAAFEGFDPNAVAKYGARQVSRLMGDAGIVRNRLKIESTISNARAVLEVQREHGSLDAFLWDAVGGKTRVNRPRTIADVPAKTPVSDALSKTLKKRGFRFVGSTIVYAFMQATGMVDDHVGACFRARAGRPRA